MRGGCLCGSIRYELTSPPPEAYRCHCRDCRRVGGGAFLVLGVVARGATRIVSGVPSAFEHRSRGGSGTRREFCGRCGTPLFFASTRFEDIRMFTVGSLDEPGSIRPSFDIWTDSKAAWVTLEPSTRSFPRGASDGSGN